MRNCSMLRGRRLADVFGLFQSWNRLWLSQQDDDFNQPQDPILMLEIPQSKESHSLIKASVIEITKQQSWS